MVTKVKGNLVPPHSEKILEITILHNSNHRTTQCENPEHNSVLIAMETCNIIY